MIPPSPDPTRTMPADAVVTGVGPVSAIGSGRADFWKSLRKGRHGFGPITRCSTEGSSSTIGAEVGDFDLADYLPRGRALARRLPRCVQLAMGATALATQDARLDCAPDRIGLVVATSLGSLQETLEAYESRSLTSSSQPSEVDPAKAFYLFNHSAACVISAEFDFRGPMLTISTGCNSTLDAIGVASMLLQSDQADAVIVVGTDSELFPAILAALNSAGALSTSYNDQPERASRPFDQARDGNVIGEGAGALVVERQSPATDRGAPILARLAAQVTRATGRGRSYRAHKPNASAEPLLATMEETLRRARWAPRDVDVVNANGSSSVIYDAVEATALSRVFRDRGCTPAVHSVKSMLGQHGAGSSALQLISACLSLKHQVVPATLNLDDPDPTCSGLDLVRNPRDLRASNTLVQAIGFGGFYHSAAALSAL